MSDCLSFHESVTFFDRMREIGLQQFAQLYHEYKDIVIDRDLLKWGDELESMILYAPQNDLTICQVHVIAEEMVGKLKNDFKKNNNFGAFQREYVKFVIESIPKYPYRTNTNDLLCVETNMLHRRAMIESLLNSNSEYLSGLCSFPLVGITKTSDRNIGTVKDQSDLIDLLVCKNLIYQNPYNFEIRSKRSVSLNIPIFQDKYTREECINIDSLVYGASCVTVQATIECSSLEECKFIYDQFGIITPILMALGAATPYFKGKLTNLDGRWDVVCACCDDRTMHEKQTKKFVKGRWSTISTFLSERSNKYNDIKLNYIKKHYDYLVNNKFWCSKDDLLAKHIASLFIRDPLLVRKKDVNFISKYGSNDGDNDNDNDNLKRNIYDKFQFTNWHNVRLKAPLIDNATEKKENSFSWRVEIRPIARQITEYENAYASFVIFIMLLTKAILFYKLNFYMCLSKVDINCQKAVKIDAVRKEKFWWRTDSKADTIDEMSISDIFCNKNNGLLTIVESYIYHCKKYSDKEIEKIKEYLILIKLRSNGQLLTTAQFLRQYILNHKLYKHDSIICQTLTRSMCDMIQNIINGSIKCSKLLPNNINIEQRRMDAMKTFKALKKSSSKL